MGENEDASGFGRDTARGILTRPVRAAHSGSTAAAKPGPDHGRMGVRP